MPVRRLLQPCAIYILEGIGETLAAIESVVLVRIYRAFNQSCISNNLKFIDFDVVGERYLGGCGNL